MATRSLAAAVGALLGLAVSLEAQQRPLALDTTSSELVLQSASDSAVLGLRSASVYRATVTPAGGDLLVRHVRLRAKPVLAPKRDASGEVLYYQVSVPNDGDYVIRVRSGAFPVTVRVDGDLIEESRMRSRGSERRRKAVAVGILATAGRYNAYDLALESPGLADAGYDWEVGVAVANLGLFSGSLSYSQQPRGAAGDIEWIVAEGRIGALRFPTIPNRTLELGLLIRGGFGILSGDSESVTAAGLGLFASQALLEHDRPTLVLDLSFQASALGDTKDYRRGGTSGTQQRVALGLRWLP